MDTPGTNRGPGVDNLRYVPSPVGGYTKIYTLISQRYQYQNMSKLTFIIANAVIEKTVLTVLTVPL